MIRTRPTSPLNVRLPRTGDQTALAAWVGPYPRVLGQPATITTVCVASSRGVRGGGSALIRDSESHGEQWVPEMELLLCLIGGQGHSVPHPVSDC
jgi:hypothetical protein